MMTSLPGASAAVASNRAAAPLLTTSASSAPGHAAKSAWVAPAPRRDERRPVSRSISTSVYPAAACSASIAASGSGARPKFVWMITPVALMTGCKEWVLWSAKRRAISSSTPATGTSPRRAAAVMARSLSALIQQIVPADIQLPGPPPVGRVVVRSAIGARVAMR